MGNETRKIAFFDAKPYDINSFSQVVEEKNNGSTHFDIKYLTSRLNSDTVSLTKGFDAVCIFVNDQVDEEVAQALYANNIRLLALRCAGYNNVLLSAVYRHIHVVRVPAYSPHAVAEHALALMLTLNRKTHKAYYRIRDNNFNINGLLGFDMYGKTAGVIGAGRIGRILVEILSGLGMKVVVYDHYQDPQFTAETGCSFVDLESLYRKSDIISLHCPLTKDTYHMINKQSIELMKPGVMIINTGRGQLINTKALIGGLKRGRIGSAGLDVYEEESEYFFEDFSNTNIEDDVLVRLMSFNNVLITSHQAFFTKEALSNIAHTTLQNISDFFSVRELENEICYRCGTETCLKKAQGKCF